MRSDGSQVVVSPDGTRVEREVTDEETWLRSNEYEVDSSKAGI